MGGFAVVLAFFLVAARRERGRHSPDGEKFAECRVGLLLSLRATASLVTATLFRPPSFPRWLATTSTIPAVYGWVWPVFGIAAALRDLPLFYR
jgi:hypothetical protein